ncbi:MAG: hypothetical protein UT50_C0002G0027 [Candidatus Moranbacteria bacterium GW2011_GWA2_39_41]|nr:MAG: hypothetical protein UT50_C0002G0027 [Candidatus Moranbacteria bacterium GW2011_GWA2_39_41]
MSVKKKIFLDGLHKEESEISFFDLSMARFVGKYKNSSTFLSKKGRTEFFYTEDSNRYITPAEFRKIEKGERIARVFNRLDSALSRDFKKTRIYSIGQRDIVYVNIKRRYESLGNYIKDLLNGAVQGVTVARMWNLSIVGAVIFGMLTMTMIYKYLGQNVSAAIEDATAVTQAEQASALIGYAGDNVVDAKSAQDSSVDDIDTSFVTKLLEQAEEKEDGEFEQELREMVRGYPIEVMIPEIVKQNRIVAAFIVAIAKKESAWGKRVPVLDGQDCYNYWGYRGIRDKMGTGGHTCFDSPEDAVATVAKRIGFLVSNKKLTTPDEMVIWKCGSNCAVTGGQAAANKWISDVSMYFDKLNK